MLVRIYGVHVNDYEDILETLPDEMVHAILKAPICKRMADPDACNPKCSMGYDFWLRVNIAKKMPQQCVYVFGLPAKQSIYSDINAKRS